MKYKLYVILLLAGFCWQCNEKKEPVPQHGTIRETDILDFSARDIDQKNITVTDDLVVIHLPENYPHGDFIKPQITFGAGYQSQSPLVNGFNFQGQTLTLHLESQTRTPKTFQIIVIPEKPVKLDEPAKDLQLTIGPDAAIAARINLAGTLATLGDSGKLVNSPIVRITNKATGAIAQELYPEPNQASDGNLRNFKLPAATIAGEYTAEVVWGTSTVPLSSNITIKSGPVQFKRLSYAMSEGERYFEVTGFNLSPADQYEAIIRNDFIAEQRIPLKYEKTGILSGMLPETIGPGNYKITFLENGKESEPYLERIGIEAYSGDDHFYIRKYSDQPIARIVTQPSLRSNFRSDIGIDLAYYPSAKELSRSELILVHTQYQGATPEVDNLILVNQTTRKEYTIPRGEDIYFIFDGFITFSSYQVPPSIPNGKYELYVVKGKNKTERYSQVVDLK